jgi:hypothetical protein
MDRTKESDVSIQTLKKQIQELQGQLAQLDSKCQSQANIIALLEHAVNDDGEEDEDDTDMMMHDMDMEEEGETKDDYHQEEIMNDYLEELKSVKQQMATKSVCREETIAWLMEENELKDAKLEIWTAWCNPSWRNNAIALLCRNEPRDGETRSKPLG